MTKKRKSLSTWRPHWLGNKIIYYGSLAGALLALGGLWSALGWPTPAWSSDIQRLNARQASTAVDVYSRAISDDMILKSQVTDQMTKDLIDDRIKMNTEKLEDSQKRKIELSR